MHMLNYTLDRLEQNSKMIQKGYFHIFYSNDGNIWQPFKYLKFNAIFTKN